MEKNLSDILFGRHIKKSGIKRKHDTPQKPSKIHTTTTTTTTTTSTTSITNPANKKQDHFAVPRKPVKISTRPSSTITEKIQHHDALQREDISKSPTGDKLVRKRNEKQVIPHKTIQVEDKDKDTCMNDDMSKVKKHERKKNEGTQEKRKKKKVTLKKSPASAYLEAAEIEILQRNTDIECEPISISETDFALSQISASNPLDSFEVPLQKSQENDINDLLKRLQEGVEIVQPMEEGNLLHSDMNVYTDSSESQKFSEKFHINDARYLNSNNDCLISKPTTFTIKKDVESSKPAGVNVTQDRSVSLTEISCAINVTQGGKPSSLAQSYISNNGGKMGYTKEKSLSSTVSEGDHSFPNQISPAIPISIPIQGYTSAQQGNIYEMNEIPLHQLIGPEQKKPRKKTPDISQVSVKHIVKENNGVTICSLSIDLPKNIDYVITNFHQGRQSFSNILTPVGNVNFRRRHDLVKSEKSVEDTCNTALSFLSSN